MSNRSRTVDEVLYEHAQRTGASPSSNHAARNASEKRTGSKLRFLALVPLPPAAFRTILAQVAALCNEYSPNAVTPYGGKGLLTVKGPPPTVVRVAFVNSPNEQRLEGGRHADVSFSSSANVDSAHTSTAAPNVGKRRGRAEFLRWSLTLRSVCAIGAFL